MQVLRTVSDTCSAAYWVLLALQLASMLLIGMCIAIYMQRKVHARKKQMSSSPLVACTEDEAVEMTPMRRWVGLVSYMHVHERIID
jgi:amino acid permease